MYESGNLYCVIFIWFINIKKIYTVVAKFLIVAVKFRFVSQNFARQLPKVKFAVEGKHNVANVINRFVSTKPICLKYIKFKVELCEK